MNSIDSCVRHMRECEAYFERSTSVLEEGEYSLFYFGGDYSHAILKTPKAGDFRVQEEHVRVPLEGVRRGHDPRSVVDVVDMAAWGRPTFLDPASFGDFASRNARPALICQKKHPPSPRGGPG